MALVTPRTCGGFAESGRIDAGPLSFEICAPAVQTAGPPATLWASSLDGEPLERSSRILLTHLTDVQGKGAQYADDSRKILLKWGHGCLIEAGAADVELRLAEANPDGDSEARPEEGSGATPPTVWSLDTAGHRIAEIPSMVLDGALRFRVSTDGPAGGRIYYEILRP